MIRKWEKWIARVANISSEIKNCLLELPSVNVRSIMPYPHNGRGIAPL